MDISEYLELVAGRLKAAIVANNAKEVVRLMRLVAKTCTEQADKLERGQ